MTNKKQRLRFLIQIQVIEMNEKKMRSQMLWFYFRSVCVPRTQRRAEVIARTFVPSLCNAVKWKREQITTTQESILFSSNIWALGRRWPLNISVELNIQFCMELLYWHHWWKRWKSFSNSRIASVLFDTGHFLQESDDSHFIFRKTKRGADGSIVIYIREQERWTNETENRKPKRQMKQKRDTNEQIKSKSKTNFVLSTVSWALNIKNKHSRNNKRNTCSFPSLNWLWAAHSSMRQHFHGSRALFICHDHLVCVCVWCVMCLLLAKCRYTHSNVLVSLRFVSIDSWRPYSTFLCIRMLFFLSLLGNLTKISYKIRMKK